MLTLWSVWVLTPQLKKHRPRSWLSVVIKNPMALLVKSRGVTRVSWPNSHHWPLSIMVLYHPSGCCILVVVEERLFFGFLWAKKKKSILVASQNWSWATDVTWTVLPMHLLRFWTWKHFSCIAVYGGSKSSPISSKKLVELKRRRFSNSLVSCMYRWLKKPRNQNTDLKHLEYPFPKNEEAT